MRIPGALEHHAKKWIATFWKNMMQNKRSERRFDSIKTHPALVVATLASLITAAPAVAAPTLPHQSWSSLYVFGDSYSDSGAGYVDGNGPTAVVYMAQGLGIPFTYAGDPNAGTKGLNFAVSGAQTGEGEGHHYPAPGNGEPASVRGRGLMTQVEDFTGQVKAGGIRFDGATTLFFIAGGLNDRKLPTETTVANLEGEIRQLYADGARYFMVALLPTKIPQFADVGLRLNPALAQIPADLAPSLPGAHIAISHWGAFYDDVITSPQAYGITNTHDRCAGRAVFGEDTTPCATPDSYFFYHEGHPSTAVHRAVGLRLVSDVKAAFPPSS